MTAKPSLRDQWATPVWVLERARTVLYRMEVLDSPDKWDLDPASHDGAESNQYCKRWVGAGEDGLACVWHGNVWCNPPYSDPGPWVNHAIKNLRARSAASVMFLLPLGRGAKWDDALLRHTPPPGVNESSPTFASALYILTRASVEFSTTPDRAIILQRQMR